MSRSQGRARNNIIKPKGKKIKIDRKLVASHDFTAAPIGGTTPGTVGNTFLGSTQQQSNPSSFINQSFGNGQTLQKDGSKQAKQRRTGRNQNYLMMSQDISSMNDHIINTIGPFHDQIKQNHNQIPIAPSRSKMGKIPSGLGQNLNTLSEVNR